MARCEKLLAASRVETLINRLGLLRKQNARKKKVREMVFTEASELEPQARTADGERLAMARQTAAWLELEIRKLPLAQREVLILTCIESLPQKDVAETLNIPINTVKIKMCESRSSRASVTAEGRRSSSRRRRRMRLIM